MLKCPMIVLLLALTIPVSQADVDTNRGQVVSDCNQRASARDLQGQDRQDFVDRCVARHDTSGEEHANHHSDCKARADARGLRDEARRDFINQCVGPDDRPSHD